MRRDLRREGIGHAGIEVRRNEVVFTLRDPGDEGRIPEIVEQLTERPEKVVLSGQGEFLARRVVNHVKLSDAPIMLSKMASCWCPPSSWCFAS